MWLRQITGGQTSSLQVDRNPSPAPNRNPYAQNAPPAPGRNNFGERTSSLTALSDAGSQPRSPPLNRDPSSPSLRGLDPVSALEHILGDLPISPREQRKPNLDTDIDFGGLGLSEFAEQPLPSAQPREHSSSNLQDTSTDLTEDQLEDLHTSIAACDQILQSVENYLASFQGDLKVVSSEIETLQVKSHDFTTRMDNRERVKKLLIPAIESFTIPSSLLKTIIETPVDERWISSLAELNRRAKHLASCSDEERKFKTVQEMEPVMENLINKAVERIKDHFVSQIKAIRALGANAQMIQLRGFIQFKDLYSFLFHRNPDLAKSLTKAYVHTMRWYYLSNFSRYAKALEKINLYSIDKSVVLGNVDDLGKKSTKMAGGKFTASQYDPFSAGRRLDITKNPSPAAISSYVAEEDKSHHYLEIPFYAFNLALIDNVSFEYNFLTRFFSSVMSFHEISRMFSSIFDPAIAQGKSITTRLVADTFDSIGILLAIRINQAFAFKLQRHTVPTMDDYINFTNLTLWPRFQQVMDHHSESIKKATANVSARTTAIALLSGAGSSSNSALSTAPHPLTQRFGNFLHALLSLSTETSEAEPLSPGLTRLCGDFEAFLSKVGRGLADAKQAGQFLSNNYQLLLTIIDSVDGPLAEKTRAHFSQVLASVKDRGSAGRRAR